MKKIPRMLLIIFAVLLVAFLAYVYGPLVSCRLELPEHYTEAIESQSKKDVFS